MIRLVVGTWNIREPKSGTITPTIIPRLPLLKDIYCDNEGWNPGACVFWTHNATAPSGEICVSPNDDVYINDLWEKEDAADDVHWASLDGGKQDHDIEGDEIGGTHESGLIVGDNNIDVGGNNWLARNHGEDVIDYPAMQACIDKGEGWRLPNIRELDSIRDQSDSPHSKLPPGLSYNYWASTVASSSDAMFLWFGDGDVYDTHKGSSERIRCIRR